MNLTVTTHAVSYVPPDFEGRVNGYPTNGMASAITVVWRKSGFKSRSAARRAAQRWLNNEPALGKPGGEDQSTEWFYRWASRAMGGNCTAETAIGIIFSCPNNPYAENNPWATSAPGEAVQDDVAEDEDALRISGVVRQAFHEMQMVDEQRFTITGEKRLMSVYIAEAIRAVPAVQPASVVDGWRPIETAPKDGTLILASAYNLNGEWLDPRVIMWSIKKHYWILPDLGLSLLVEPIFWQPLPEKPYLPTPQKAKKP